jgi:DNA primase
LLFNSRDLLTDADVLYVTEGELDAVTVSGTLGLPCIGYPGTESWRPYMTRAISNDWSRIIVIADGDKPGREAARSVARHFPGVARVWRCPDGEDTNSLLMQHGVDQLKEALSAETEY